MNILEAVKAAFISLSLNKTRSFLTMLGVIIGVFAVISLVSLVKGVENFVTDQFNALGSNLILVAPGRTGFNQDPAVTFTNNKLRAKHIELIEKYAGNYIVGVTPSIRVGKTVKYKNKQFAATVSGVNEKAFQITDVSAETGRNFTEGEVSSKARVTVIGPQVSDELFGEIDPLGKKVTVEGIAFEVIGVLNKKGLNSDDRILVPYTSLDTYLGIDKFSGIATKAKDGQKIDIVMGQVELALLHDLKADEFDVLSQKDILSSVSNILGVLSAGLGAVAAISLVVGGIGIMNIMLVSVTERTKEIGLRKALGATPSNIAVQFLSEAVVISLMGGVIGISLGWLLTVGISSLIRAQIPGWALIISVGFSVGVGVLFGTYPAITAGKKDPIESLRYE
ncbi:hypothetical protein A3K34_02140 [candidate division WWE3 bacterium RIFOXYC1_FULL_40_10]|uniref:Multidrug ABC transporter substrate-binding protein n=1 Tax=candidate division WWE3 bacterium RIFOXYA2_FULL_46_9 TaxID=1802636 RepID=A0A1F4W1P3_UNCKA|nr:MAG: hypothetical protein A3K58_02140 [candidate division WWE3 bacterium RIFOXYB1_FULL_40_22]OGC61654.1 MAG: hypothetical protein A3K37_02140 [candidate division WWE3 bacterium RIFOXYA1_FULL_40_11]OGC63280.1 MAG: hypothetical protein A2264_02760 [candidate division WWE3 bacterium RIFOXYA2_FULL_46_9]OGC64411.1 MAG: hypothetical protein A2326_02595 [candidate division WWE3 bacterium RIFOXYB2_FULL_41_6]OGC66037.1 MAG: hypothetical protein A3K34_02140 [candidate division WWE3 bacterium RIFOXYC1_